jgi:hypothetical protein
VPLFNAIRNPLFPGPARKHFERSAAEEIPDDDGCSDHRGDDRDCVEERHHQS